MFSQSGNQELDSLTNLLKHAKPDTNKVNILFNISEVCEVNDVLKYAQESFELAEKLEYKKGMANAQNNMAYSYNNDGNPSLALQFYKNSLAIREELNDSVGIGLSLNNVGDIYETQGEILKALEYYQKALAVQEKINDMLNLPATLDHLGTIFRSQKNFTSALEYYKKGLFINERNNYLPGIALSYNNISLVYLEQGNYSKALYCNQKSKNILEKINDKVGIARSLNNIAGIYVKMQNTDKALEFFRQSLAITEEINFKKGTLITLNGISIIYLKKNDLKKALEYGLRAHALSMESESPSNISSTSANLCEIFQANGEFKKALEMHILFTRMSDKINNREAQKVLLQIEFNKKEQIAKLEQEKKDAAMRQEKRQQRWILLVVIAFLLSLIIFTFILFNRFKINQRQKKIIEEKNHEVMDSIKYAKRIQTAILATEAQIKQTFKNSFLFYLPKDIVAGDFYFFEATDTHVFYAAADCTGHGVPGALVSVVCSNALLRCVNEYKLTSPGEILDKARELVIENFKKSGQDVKDGMDISLIAMDKAFLNTPKKQVEWAGANNSLLYIKENQIVETKANKQPIGQVDNPVPFKTHVIELNEGDCLYLYTDGFADQFGGPKGKKFKRRPLNELLASISHLLPEKQVQELNLAYENWRTSDNERGEKCEFDQVDDICIIGIKFN